MRRLLTKLAHGNRAPGRRGGEGSGQVGNSALKRRLGAELFDTGNFQPRRLDRRR
jgi:hypothetical protein